MKMIVFAALFLTSASALAGGKTVTIAVIDTGIDKHLPHLCKMGHKSFLNHRDPLVDTVGHGTHVAGLINRNAVEGNYCMVALQYYSEINTGKENLRNMIAALKYAINIKVDFINISGGGPEFAEEEYILMKKALDMGIKVVVAAGNEHDDLDKWCNFFPACYDARIVRVGNLEIARDYRNLDEGWKKIAWASGMGDKIGTVEYRRSPTSNYGNIVNRWEIGTNCLSDLPGGKTGYMSGTSMSTAVATGKLVREKLSK